MAPISALADRDTRRGPDLEFDRGLNCELDDALRTAPRVGDPRRIRNLGVTRRRPGPVRPAVIGARPMGTGVRLSRAPHGRFPTRQVTPLTVIGLAVLAALITVWLGVVAQFGEQVRSAAAPVPDRLAVVQVQAGESLQQLAARVAPDAPVHGMVDRIRELNKLDSVVLTAGQTLIAPVG